jgi:hypothetical protein
MGGVLVDAEDLLAEARSTYHQGEIGTAKELYRRVIKDHKGTEEAEIAQVELDNILTPSRSRREQSGDQPKVPASISIQRVTVVDLDVKFWTMVWLMIKFAIAAIPAMIVLYLIAAALFAMFGMSGRMLM